MCLARTFFRLIQPFSPDAPALFANTIAVFVKQEIAATEWVPQHTMRFLIVLVAIPTTTHGVVSIGLVVSGIKVFRLRTRRVVALVTDVRGVVERSNDTGEKGRCAVRADLAFVCNSDLSISVTINESRKDETTSCSVSSLFS